MVMTWPTNPNIQRANKQGITFVACKRKRKKAIVSISLTEQGRMYANTRAQGDMARFLSACKSKTTFEAQEIADKLNWSRDAVLIYKARAEERGHVTSWKDSDEKTLLRAQAIIEKRNSRSCPVVSVFKYDSGELEGFCEGVKVATWQKQDRNKPIENQRNIEIQGQNYFIHWACKV